jgi:predicted CoA-binding protein
MSFQNPSLDEIRALLDRIQTIAVVGLSPRPDRPSHEVAAALQRFGYRVVPVRPATDQILGEKAYASLAEVPMPLDLVDVFRAPEHVDPIVDASIELGVPAIWLQEGVINESAAERARAAGLFVVMNRCIFKEYSALKV